MSTQLTWRRTTAAKTGTAAANFVNDIVSAVNAVSGDANYKWQVASSNNAATPFYVVLKRKDGAAGRILIVHWSSAPAGNNAAILDQAPTTTHVFIAWFPAGNTDTPLNLTASSGTILGDDTNVLKCVSIGSLATIYATSFQPYVWDSQEAIWITLQNPASGTPIYGCAGGKIYVDKDDNDQDGVFGHGTGSFEGLGKTTPTPQYTITPPLAGSISAHLRSNKGASNRIYFAAYARVGSWADQLIADSILFDGSNSKAWFDAFLLVCQTKGVGPDLKLRQVAVGPPTVAAFSVFNTSLLTPAALSSQANGSSTSGNPWFTNFKV